MNAPAQISALIERFEQQLEDYKSGKYNETQLRREFLDPFFKALGWDIDNVSGWAEAYKDVVHEDAIRIGGAVKAPDYSFRIGGTRKFFLEAKKPSVDIKEDISPAYQLRRYAWSAKLPLSILSDFEELAIYDCRIKPGKDDKASVGRVFYCTFKEYAEKWDYLTSIFSREAVLKGSFDRFAESTKAKKGTAEVDTAFLEEIESWRRELAQNLAIRNARLTQRELNFAVQRIIDRIIFLRICEDRGIEDYGRLRGLVNGERIYPRLCQLFEAADARYNSGLFHLPVFANAKDTYVCIPLFAKGGKNKRVEVSKVDSLEIRNLTEHADANHFTIPHERLNAEAWALKSDKEAAVFAKVMKAGKPLGDYVERKIFYGIKTGLNEAFEVSDTQRTALIKKSSSCKTLIKPFLGGQNIRRYTFSDERRYLIVVPCGWTRQQMIKARQGAPEYSERVAWNWFSSEYPSIAEHLTPYAEALRRRQDQGDYWWELRPCDYYEYLDGAKIIYPDICKGPRFHLDRTGIYIANTAYCLGADDHYLLGILNSRLFWFAIGNISIPFGIRAGRSRYRLIYQYMEKVPIRVINFTNAVDKIRHDRIVNLVESMLELPQKLAAVKTPQEQTSLERQITVTDNQIDQLVYELYDLTPEEIAIVEGAASEPAIEEAVATDSIKAKKVRTKKSLYAEPPPKPPGPGITPEKARADAAHFYYGKEEAPPYKTE